MIVLPLGFTACGCLEVGRNPCHSYAPVPMVGRPRSTPSARTGTRPLENIAMLLMSANPSALISSRPRVERLFEIATRCPSDLAYPLTGPCTVSLNVTGPAGGPGPGPRVPASNGVMAAQSPLNTYSVSLPSHSVSTY